MISSDESVYQVFGRLTGDCDDVDDSLIADAFGSASSDGSSVSSSNGDETCQIYDLNVTDFETGKAILSCDAYREPSQHRLLRACLPNQIVGTDRCEFELQRSTL